jgi:XTP/dITP diphosphohydrolase
MTTQLVIASGNQGKIKEFNEMLTPHQLECVAQDKFNVPQVPETASTFVENALLKARNSCKYTKLPSIADDSGLVIPAIDNQPGLYSARFAGSGDDGANIDKVLELMADIPREQRSAYYISVIVYLQNAADPTPIICQGIWHGSILTARIGDGGFGYDPIFGVSSHKMSAAQLPSSIKNTISHRYIAMAQLVKHLQHKMQA